MSDKIKILLLTTDSRLSGTEKSILQIAKNINKETFNPHICALLGDGDLISSAKKENLPALSLNMRCKCDIGAFIRFAKFLQREKFDIVHSFLFHANTFARLAKKMGYAKKVIASERFVDYKRSALKVLVNKLLQNQDDLMTCNCIAIKEIIKKREGYDGDKIQVIYNGVDLNEMNATATKNEFREHLKIPSDAKVVVMTARFRKEKGHPILLNAMPKILKERRDARLVLIGDGETLPSAKALAAKLKIEQNVIFPGRVANVYDYLNACDVVAHISHDEGLPNAVIEAFAFKKPVVATDTAGTNEIVENNANGFLVKDYDSAEVAEKIIMLLNDERKSMLFGLKGHEQVKNFFRKDEMIKRYEELYKTVISK